MPRTGEISQEAISLRQLPFNDTLSAIAMRQITRGRANGERPVWQSHREHPPVSRHNHLSFRFLDANFVPSKNSATR